MVVLVLAVQVTLHFTHLNSSIHCWGMLPLKATISSVMPCSYTSALLPSDSSTYKQQHNGATQEKKTVQCVVNSSC